MAVEPLQSTADDGLVTAAPQLERQPQVAESAPLEPPARASRATADVTSREAWARLLPRVLLFVFGVLVLWRVSLLAFGGGEHLFRYTSHVAHKMTAQAMLHGSLAMNRNMAAVTMNDEQVYDGAGFTNWQFGVPLLQIPFQALVPLLGHSHRSHLFPDRLVFFVYMACLAPLLWTAVQRAMTTRAGVPPGLSSWFCSWAATLLVLAYALFPLLAFRFIVYEETIAYFVLAQLYALACYALFVHSRKPGWLVACGVAAGFGLLIRATGLPYLLLWGALLVLADRRVRTASVFCAAVAPLVGFWLWSNWVKGGSPLTLGYQNSLPDFPFHTPMQRFGARCEAASDMWTMAGWLFEAFFLRTPTPTPVMAECHTLFESRLLGDSSPYFPVSVFVIMVGGALYSLARRRLSPAYYLPQAVFLALFFAHARNWIGFSYRYVGDFWPLVPLVLIQLAPAAKLDRSAGRSLALGGAFLVFAAATIVGDDMPLLPTIDDWDDVQMARIAEDFRKSDAASQPMPLGTRIACGDRLPTWPRANGKGWAGNCEVDTYTNLYLNVPHTTDGLHHLTFTTDRPLGDALEVYVNGKIYTAHRQADRYAVDFALDDRKMFSPIVMIAVRWTSSLFPPRAKLLEMELA
jgi:hypothetical protein